MQTVVRRYDDVLHCVQVWRGEGEQFTRPTRVREQLLFREETLTLSARQIATAHEAARQNMNLFREKRTTSRRLPAAEW